MKKAVFLSLVVVSQAGAQDPDLVLENYCQQFLGQQYAASQTLTDKYCRLFLEEFHGKKATKKRDSAGYAPALSLNETPKVQEADALKALEELKEFLNYDRSTCQNRKVCYDNDVKNIDKFAQKYARATAAYKAIQEFKKSLEKFYNYDIFPSQLALYANLTAAGQNEFLAGVQLTLPSQYNALVSPSFKVQYRSYYDNGDKSKKKKQILNKDDVLIYLIQQINSGQQSCNERSSCLQKDVRTISDFKNQTYNDKDLNDLLEAIIRLINENYGKDIFDTRQFLDAYIVSEQTRQPINYFSNPRQEFEKIKQRIPKINQRREIRVFEAGIESGKNKKKDKDDFGKQLLQGLLGGGSQPAPQGQQPYQYPPQQPYQQPYQHPTQQPNTPPPNQQQSGGGLLGLLGSLFS